jgi:hypothetical protein
MAKTISATLRLDFSSGKEDAIDLQTNDVPRTLILEHLQNISRFLARQICEEAEEILKDPKEQEKYINARIKVDRETLDKMLK